MRKFIINNGEIKFANVDYHREIARDHSTTIGGGWWHIDFDKRVIWMYSTSMDFGQARREDLQELIINENYSLSFDGFIFYHSYSEKLSDALNDAVKLN